MLKRTILRTVVAAGLMFSALAITGCQTTGKARPEMLTGDAKVAHERHATGIDSHTADHKQ